MKRSNSHCPLVSYLSDCRSTWAGACFWFSWLTHIFRNSIGLLARNSRKLEATEEFHCFQSPNLQVTPGIDLVRCMSASLGPNCNELPHARALSMHPFPWPRSLFRLSPGHPALPWAVLWVCLCPPLSPATPDGTPQPDTRPGPVPFYVSDAACRNKGNYLSEHSWEDNALPVNM